MGMALEEFAQVALATDRRNELRRLVRDLEKDLARLRGFGIDPETFAGGCHARFVREIRFMAGIGH
jgi:hypothetical protein